MEVALALHKVGPRFAVLPAPGIDSEENLFNDILNENAPRGVTTAERATPGGEEKNTPRVGVERIRVNDVSMRIWHVVVMGSIFYRRSYRGRKRKTSVKLGHPS